MTATNMLPNEDLPACPDAVRIKLEGPRTDPPRPVRRCIVAVRAVADVDRATCEQVNIEGGKTVTLETYVDRLPRIAERVRTAEHHAAWTQAVQMNEQARKLEAEARQRDRAVVGRGSSDDYMNARGKTWNGHPSVHLAILGYRTGLPPLEAAEVVHPTDPSAPRIEIRAFLALPAEDRAAYTIAPPATLANQAERSADVMAMTMAKALHELRKMDEKGAKK